MEENFNRENKMAHDFRAGHNLEYLEKSWGKWGTEYIRLDRHGCIGVQNCTLWISLAIMDGMRQPNGFRIKIPQMKSSINNTKQTDTCVILLRLLLYTITTT